MFYLRRVKICLLLLLLLPIYSLAQEDTMSLANGEVSYSQLRGKLKNAITTRNSTQEAEAHNELGDYFWYSGNYPRAAEHYYTALAIAEKKKDSVNIGVCFRNIGWIYFGQNDNASAERYFLRAVDIFSRHRPQALLSSYDDLANLNRESGDFEEGLKYARKAIELAKTRSLEGYATSTVSLATIYREMGKYQAAIAQYKFAIELYGQDPNPYNEAVANVDMGKCYVALKEPGKAIECLERARAIALDNHYTQLSLEVMAVLGPAYALTGNYQRAYYYRDRYAVMTDSLQKSQELAEIQKMHQQHQSQKRLNYVRNLRKQKEFGQQKLQQEKRLKALLIGVLILVVGFAYFFFRSFRQKKKANETLSATYRLLEEKNSDIADSINYARRIQTARLPDVQLFSKLFPESFCLYLPKDVVSGDFYWLAEIDGKPTVVAADCTGHGVPGAFMSLIGMDSLERAARVAQTPGELLSETNKFLKSSLKQQNASDSSRDGMDAAVCQIDYTAGEILFSGANRPLWLVRDGQMHEFSSTKVAIGGFTPDNQSFAEQRIPFLPGDQIYLTSDGYADQFGGPNDKKFSSRRLRNMICEQAHNGLAEQKEHLAQALKDWKAEGRQIDDVLIIGISL